MAGDTRADTKTGGRPATSAVIAGDFALSVGSANLPAPKGWTWKALSSIARLETGHTPSRRHPEYWGGDIPWIGITDATDNDGQVLQSTKENTNELGVANSSARVLPAGTVCLSRTASVGYVVVMGRPMSTSQDFINWVCGGEINPKFLMYVLLAERRALRMIAFGTTHQTIYFPEAKAFHVCLPNRKEQDAIAELLGNIADKIVLNRAATETLEAIARTLFQSWFVDFDPVRRACAGEDRGLSPNIAALFPTRLTHEGLPEGWTTTPLPKMATFLNGLALQRFPATDGVPSLPVIKIAEMRTGTKSTSARATSALPSEDYIVNDGDHLFSWSGSLTHCLWSHGPGALNQHLFKVIPTTAPAWLCYLAVDHFLPEFQRIAAAKAVTMGHIQRHHLDQAALAMPPQALLKQLGDKIEPMFERLKSLSKENRTLAALRDTLLPRLISGELRIRDVESTAESA